jgi:hypothetical protein
MPAATLPSRFSAVAPQKAETKSMQTVAGTRMSLEKRSKSVLANQPEIFVLNRVLIKVQAIRYN